MLRAVASFASQTSLRCLVAFGASNCRTTAWLGSRGVETGPSRIVDLESDEHFQQVMRDLAATNTPSVVKFTAPWCGPCKLIAPLYSQLSTEVEGVRFYTVNIDSEQLSSTVADNGVVGVPNFSFFLAGERVAFFRGAKKDQLLSRLQQLQTAQEELAAAPAQGVEPLVEPTAVALA